MVRNVEMAVILCLFACIGLYETPRIEAAERPSALMLYPGAADSIYNPQRKALTYHVNVEFPATAVIEWVSRNLQKAGWAPLNYDFLNPDSHYSGMHKWDVFLDGIHDPVLCVHQWLGDWKDASGDVVRYGFRYRERPDCRTNDLTELEVDVWYTPAADAHKVPQAIQQLKKQHNPQ